MGDSILSGTMALIDKGNFETSEYIKEPCKRTGCDFSFYDGKIYSGYAPGASVIAVPIYAVAKPFFDVFIPENFLGYSKIRISINLLNALATIFLVALLSAFTATLIYKFLGYIVSKKKDRLWITFIFSFGTLFFIYSTGYFIRVISGIILFCIFYILYLMKTNRIKINKKNLFLTGFLSSSAVTIEYSSVLVVGLLFIYLISFFRDKRIIYYIIGSIFPVILLLIYHFFIFGDFFVSAYQYHLNWNAQETVAEKELEFPNKERLWGLSFSPEKGYFFFMPIMLLSLLGLFIGFKERKIRHELILIALAFTVVFIFTASLSGSWKGNDAFGPRYLVHTIPFFIIPSVFMIERIPRITKTIGIVSIFINSLPVMFGSPTGSTLPNSIFQKFIPLLFEKGLKNYTLNLIDLKIFKLGDVTINIIMIISLLIISGIVYLIWKK